jgi:hypothetical protein
MGLLDQLFARKSDTQSSGDPENQSAEESSFGGFPDENGKRPLGGVEVDRTATLHGNLEVYLASSKKWVSLANAGSLIPARYRERLKTDKMRAWIEAPHWDQEYVDTASSFEKAFQKEQEEFILLPGQLLRPITYRWIQPYLLSSPRDSNYLDLIAMAEHFAISEEGPEFFEALQDFEDESIFWFQRSSRCAALAFHLAILLGYYERNLLKEFWKSTLFKDIAILKTRYHLSTTNNQMLRAIQGKAQFPDAQSSKHGSLSWLWMQKQSFQIRDYVDWMRACFEQHHEREDASGPLGIHSSHLIELARLQCLCDQICDLPAESLKSALETLDQEKRSGLCPILLGRLRSLCRRLEIFSHERVGDHAV